MYAAAVDQRIKAVVAQVPVVNHYRWMRWLRSHGQWWELLDRLEEDRQRRYDGFAGARIPVSTVEGFSFRPGVARTARKLAEVVRQTGKPLLAPGAPDVLLESAEKTLEFNATSVIEQIAPRALCLITTTDDEAHPIEQILEAFDKAKEPKRLLLLDMTVLDVYWEPGLGLALGGAEQWYDQYLKER